MIKINIQSEMHSYPIYIGNMLRYQIDDYLKKDYSSILIITDHTVSKLYGADIKNSLKRDKVYLEIVHAGEESKSIETFYFLHTRAIELGLDRQSLIIALGGGVIGDLAGFVAATFMRGIDYVQMPTTLLAHDSSIGGKVAINHEKGKNLIGSFYPPCMVVYDIDTLKSLPQQEIRSGYAELIKEAMLADAPLFEKLLSKSLYNLESDDLVDFLQSGIKIKTAIVEQDEKESGKRKLLNLGHTLGHALEAKLGYGTITHGEAVAIGLLFAIYVSEAEFQTTLPKQSLLKWLKENDYRLDISLDSISDLIDLMKRDKKTIRQDIQMILLKELEQPVIHTIEEQRLKEYLQSFISSSDM